MPSIRKTIAFSTLLLAICLVANQPLQQAAAEDPKQRGEAGDILTPLAIGNTWIYENEDDELITTDRIEGIVLFDGQPWHLLRSYERAKGQPEDKNEYLGSDLWLAVIDGHECDAFTDYENEDAGLALTYITRYYRYPATLGETYRPSEEDKSIVVTVTALNEKVKTKAGEFECVVYKETSTEDEGYAFTSYVAPGIGIVKYINVEEGQASTTTLTSYRFVEEKG